MRYLDRRGLTVGERFWCKLSAAHLLELEAGLTAGLTIERIAS
jgi:hypothetical protein